MWMSDLLQVTGPGSSSAGPEPVGLNGPEPADLVQSQKSP